MEFFPIFHVEDQLSSETHRSLFSRRKLDSSPKSNTDSKGGQREEHLPVVPKDGAEPLNSRGKQDLGQDYHTCSPQKVIR